ncbi:MAG TPA: hypothetical protein ENF16_02330 [Bacteroidetes bacterium]|nr:hypothetical protein [Bacteroidota bacterium]
MIGLLLRIFLLSCLVCETGDLYAQGKEDWPPWDPKNPPRGVDISNIARTNRTHRKGNLWLTVTNWGFFGNYNRSSTRAFEDPEYPGLWAPQCEYPGNSDVQYLYQGGLWVGALVQEGGFEFPRVTIGTAGWVEGHEFQPGVVGGLPIEEHGILERSTIPNSYNRLGEMVYDPDAIAEQDFIAVYTDTLTESFWVQDDVIDGPHFPLGIRVEQRSYSWSYNYAQEFILIDYTVKNIASNFLKNLYVALYVDCDVGWEGEDRLMDDDICGFQRWYYYDRILPSGATVPDSLIINTAWTSDNDGRPVEVESGSDFTSPAVTGVRVVRAPNPRLRTSFNWWIRNPNPNLDYGPAWIDDGAVGDWTSTWGTPEGDARKYFVLSNGEFDFDQVYVNDPEWIAEHPQIIRDQEDPSVILETHDWKIEANEEYATDIANGYDTRYMISWGPLGIYDHTDDQGNDIYRLNPGEEFHMTVAYVAGASFHDVQNPQEDPDHIDPAKFNFANLRYNAAWAARVYDNEMIDTNGDGWYGEDVGTDGLYAENVGDSVIYFGVYQGYLYPGPDEDGTERNGRLDAGEDEIWRPEFVYDARYGELNLGYTRFNNVLDPGDGIPDFKGPPPPPIPILSYQLSETEVLLRWKNNAEDPGYYDPFSGAQDFEGYRIYTSNSGLENDYQLLADYDRVDFAYFSANDSLATHPDTRTNAPADTIIDTQVLFRKPFGQNTGLEAIRDTDSTYVFVIKNAHPCFPRHYSVCSYDYGDPRSGTEPLETARNANAVYAAPAGNPQNEVRVIPNPYRAYENYTQTYAGGLSWENQDDGTPEFFPQTDRRIEFINLPAECLIRVYTLSGDLVQIIPHSSLDMNDLGDPNLQWTSMNSESWDLNSRNGQQIVSGLYLFSVEDLTTENRGKIKAGKFVVIR